MTSPQIDMDMTTTRAEFFRNLKVAMRDMSSTIDGDNVRVVCDDREIILKLSPMTPLVIGPTLELERWNLAIEFRGQSDEQRTAFMKTFKRAFHRGGG